MPSKVTEDIVEPQRTELSSQREAILMRRDTLKLNVAIHNAKCSNIDPAAAIADECRANQSRLRDEITTYSSDVISFNSLILETPKIQNKPDAYSMLRYNIINYFLLSRDENYAIHKSIILDMIQDPSSQEEQTEQQNEQQTQQEQAADHSSDAQSQWDKELLKPLDLQKLNVLATDQVAEVVSERQAAREREAFRKFSIRLQEKLWKLEDEGLLAPDENVIEKQKSDPELRKRYKDIFYNITKEEISDVHRARSLTLIEMGEIVEARIIDPVIKQEFSARKIDIYKKRDTALRNISSVSLRHMSEEMDRLKQEGYYSEDENLVEKDNNDPVFREAVDEAVRNVLIRQYESEYMINQKALNEMRRAAKELTEMY